LYRYGADNKRKRDEHQQGPGGGGGRGAGGRGAGYQGVPHGKSPVRLYVAGMPVTVTEELVKSVFCGHGNVKSVFLLRPRWGCEQVESS
jgi:hypothetical protein